MTGLAVAAGFAVGAGLGVAAGLFAGVAVVSTLAVGLTTGVGRETCAGVDTAFAATVFVLPFAAGSGTSPLIEPASQIFAKLSFEIVNWIRPPSAGDNGVAGKAIAFPLMVNFTDWAFHRL